ncbi:MAG: phospholipid carrier-dependent glycosyltransferase [Chloroflexi bacterium]|nr:MAG: phospholipid carrier-dependent glycosyltransferase [Chloroflexota bacterium]
MSLPEFRLAGHWQAALCAVILALIAGRFVAQAHGRSLTNSNSALGDQRAVLQLALDLREHGILTDGTRNPLYPAVLALFAHRQADFFTWAKLVNTAFGLLTILAVYVLGARLFNRWAALLAAYLLSINTEFIVHCATALAEASLVLFFTLTFFAMIASLRRPHRARWWVLAGILAGLAYLAKGTGQILAGTFLGTATLIHGFSLFKRKPVWLFLAGYALIASPLWVYNTIVFGSPTFNYAITHQIWMDSWREWHPDSTATLPTLRTYLQSHTLPQIIDRLWTGMQAMRNIFIKTLYPTRTLMVDRFLLSPVSRWTLALLAILPFIFGRASLRYIRLRQPAVYLTLFTTTLFFVLFSWYVSIVALGQRFLLPLLPMIFLLGADIVVRIWSHLLRRTRWIKGSVISLTIAAIALQASWFIRTGLESTRQFFATSVFEQDRAYFNSTTPPLEWLATQFPERETVAWGPSANSLPTWAFSDRLNFVLYPPQAGSVSALTEYLSDRGVQFIIIAPEMVEQYPILAEDFPSNGAQIVPATIPAGWAFTFAYPGNPCQWCIYRLLTTPPPRQTTDYRLADAIRLVGFDPPEKVYHPGDTVSVTLHWQADRTVPQEFTVFTHLQGPDGRLYGQMDHPPLSGAWPTSRWQPGDTLADRYDIPLTPDAPPGQYTLKVGMYLASTGERVAVSRQQKPVAEGAVPLTTFQVRPSAGN